MNSITPIIATVLAPIVMLGVLLGTVSAETGWRQPLTAWQRFRPMVGELRFDLVMEGDTLLDVAYRNRVGFESVTRANPLVDVWIPAPGTLVRLPTRAILPDVEEDGLVINIPEMRLFDFTVEGGPELFAAAVGDADDPTPIGDFRIRGKRTDPVWNVPDSIRRERPELGERVAPGPHNPLGSRWMRIGHTSYGLHGTDTRWSIGRQATHGCVRLYEPDIRRLFERTPEGTRLQLVYQPYKWSRLGTEILLEAHPDIYGHVPDDLGAALAFLRERELLHRIDFDLVWKTVEEARGVPVVVGRLAAGQ